MEAFPGTHDVWAFPSGSGDPRKYAKAFSGCSYGKAMHFVREDCGKVSCFLYNSLRISIWVFHLDSSVNVSDDSKCEG